MKKYLLSLLIALIGGMGVVLAQGTTTGSMSGIVLDEDGQPLPSANVIAVHQPSGTQYGTTTRLDGRYNLPNMRVGGPYTVTVSFVGYDSQSKTDLNLSLGQNLTLTFDLQEGLELSEVEIFAEKSDILNGDRTGAQTVVGEQQINSLPTIARDINDFTRLTPQASITSGGGISIAGQNNRYNAIYIDGAVNNDVFGLAATGTNGGQTGLSPISLDAIEEFQVVLAPYDVRQGGFAGGGINAVTRSGKNNFEGSAYWLYRNEGLAGKTPTNNENLTPRVGLAPFTSNIYGVRVGGPILQDKLFFFVSAEFERRETPAPFSFSQYTGPSAGNRALIEQIAAKAQTFGYNTGGFESVTDELSSDKLFARLDWNVNQNHKLMFRYSYVKNRSIEPANSAANRINFANGGIDFPSTTQSLALEWNANFGQFSNNLIIGYTSVRDDRDPIGKNFPYVIIQDGSSANLIQFGSEQFSTANALNQDVLTITDNFNIYKGAHTITIGTHNEFYSIYNLFTRQNYGVYTYNSINGFLTDAGANRYDRTYSNVDNVTGDGSKAASEFDAAQLGFYIQDEWYIRDNFKLTAGLRIDVPIIYTATRTNAQFNGTTLPVLEQFHDLKGARTGQGLAPQVLWSPRVGFNWDVKGDNSLQVRGGVGIFTSRIPFVWIGGSYNNNGITLASVTGTTIPINGVNSPIPFRPDVNNQYTLTDFGRTFAEGGQVDLFAKDFKYPQMFRANLAVDKQLPWGMIGTLEAIYTKTINNIAYNNLSKIPTGRRLNNGGDNRIQYQNIPPLRLGNYGDVLLGYNTSKGYSYSITAQLQKPFDNGFTASVAYTYGEARALNDGLSSQNNSQWRFVQQVNGRNNPDLAASTFDLGSRVVAAVSYRKEWLDNFATTISVFYNGQSGQRFSYIYGRSSSTLRFNGEDPSSADLIYVPRSASDINLVDQTTTTGGVTTVTKTAAQQWAELDEFIKSDKYLNDRRGDYARRNGRRTPFEHILDLRIAQDFYIETGSGTRHTLQVTFDVFNFTNALNKNWGRRYFVTNDAFELITFRGFAADGVTPQFNFNKPQTVWQADDSGINSSRWQAQIGVRYTF